MSSLNEKVVRVHIGTHDFQRDKGTMFDDIQNIFAQNNWTSQFKYKSIRVSCRQFSFYQGTDYGPVCFADGVASFANKRFKHLQV